MQGLPQPLSVTPQGGVGSSTPWMEIHGQTITRGEVVVGIDNYSNSHLFLGAEGGQGWLLSNTSLGVEIQTYPASSFTLEEINTNINNRGALNPESIQT